MRTILSGWYVPPWMKAPPESSRWPSETPLSYKEIQHRGLHLGWWKTDCLCLWLMLAKREEELSFRVPASSRGGSCRQHTPCVPCVLEALQLATAWLFKRQLGCEAWLQACSCTELCSPLSLRPCLGPFLSVKVLIVISVTESHSLSVLLCLHPQFLWMSFHGMTWSAPTEMQLSEINLSHPFPP